MTQFFMSNWRTDTMVFMLKLQPNKKRK
jgi:hypothetical protein